MNLFDSHCHIDGEAFNDDRAEVLTQARAAGVKKMMVIGLATHGGDLSQALRFAKANENVWASIGVHPHDTDAWHDDDYQELSRIAKDPKVLAIGETGLDYHYDRSPRLRQIKRFNEHIALAHELQKTLVCHIRDAHEDARRELQAGPRIPTIIHCFTGSWDDAKAYLDLGCHISFSGIVTFKGASANNIREAAQKVPHDRLLIETDSPFLAPVPHRGKRCEPKFLSQTATYLADLRGEDSELFAQRSFEATHQALQLAKKS